MPSMSDAERLYDEKFGRAYSNRETTKGEKHLSSAERYSPKRTHEAEQRLWRMYGTSRQEADEHSARLSGLRRYEDY